MHKPTLVRRLLLVFTCLIFIALNLAVVCVFRSSPSNLCGTAQENLTHGSFDVENRHPADLGDVAVVGQSFNEIVDSVVPRVKISDVDCKLLFEGDLDELHYAEEIMTQTQRHFLSDERMFLKSKNCTKFVKERQYILSSLTKEEEEFPLAFSIMVYKNAEQVERLLRAIYRPQNFYCFHVDNKSSPAFLNAMTSLSSCFDNVFVANTHVNVVWAEVTVLDAELVCMEELFKRYYKKWKYFINLTGQEFPLKTNMELVKILKAYGGANDMEGTLKRRNMDRFTKEWDGHLHLTGQTLPPAPFGIVPTKGAVHITATWGFVNFTLTDPIAKEFLKWTRKTHRACETFFTSLNHNPHLMVPGSFTGSAEALETKPFMTRYKIWVDESIPFCGGKFVRAICIFGLEHLPRLFVRNELFANKFHQEFQPYTLDCMEEWHYNKTRLGYSLPFNTQHYRSLPFVKDKII
ncbi:beta-1,3-galactosyl-O-glycosyl-glycoprotein beta-1,6-N-acetylglucosaminyltransferase isoform X2 [Lingula anatina]|uniref:Beta-1,3-galactosyl-O-glycosyl-glycoprotein beta-1,6-N-acetylglucosaminyltransferase isoform X2 n=1 Tax=Lingula anatina TaxID=7574 RepID=A0A1S3JL02_LINAN|nr:beta-1,3-galactosyl-O-glycosyl-glycoprotein beta-1,6-N-acetylglucosaminyltransferase isoform X2 [Lingula anatina]|eukprot:XP_013411058.1 beta-1,3-galactosyl-O-glycosyl-glycoprotein beta-1,6-N-acetylglucosaminyltransferase isoform X2 [Lingula anatina]